VAAFVAWQLMQNGGGEALSIAAAIGAAIVLCLLYGLLVAPLLADREPVVQARRRSATRSSCSASAWSRGERTAPA